MSEGKRAYYAKTPISKGRKLKVIEGVRVCQADGCPTILSKYNRDPLCYVHAPPKKIRTRGRLPQDRSGDMVDTSIRCYACTIRLGGWGQPAEEVEIDGTFHWMVSIAGSATQLCDIR